MDSWPAMKRPVRIFNSREQVAALHAIKYCLCWKYEASDCGEVGKLSQTHHILVLCS